MTGLKIALLSVLAGALSSVVGDTATQIAVIAGGVAGGIYLFRKLAQALKLAIRVLGHWADTLQVLQALPEWVTQLNGAQAAMRRDIADVAEQQAALEKKVDAIHEPVKAVERELGIEHRRPAP